MAEANGHAPPFQPAVLDAPVTPEEFDALLAGTFEPVLHEIAPGKFVEIRPLLLGQADRLYSGALKGDDLQRYLLSRSVYVNGRPLGEANVERIPMPVAQKLLPAVMRANGMDGFMQAGEAGDQGADPKA